jgi:hypothetical protein
LVYPNRDENLDAIREHGQLFHLRPEQLWDPNHALVKEAGVTLTPEAAILVPGHGVVYRGRIDNRFVRLGVARPEATEHDLHEALDAVLEGRPAALNPKPGIGCSISVP